MVELVPLLSESWENSREEVVRSFQEISAALFQQTTSAEVAQPLMRVKPASITGSRSEALQMVVYARLANVYSGDVLFTVRRGRMHEHNAADASICIAAVENL